MELAAIWGGNKLPGCWKWSSRGWMNIPWEWEGFLHWVATHKIEGHVTISEGTTVMGGLLCQQRLRQKDDQIHKQTKVVHALSYKHFYWVVTFPKQQHCDPQQHCAPQINCWLNINLVSSPEPNARSKALGHSRISNMMLTRPGFEWSRLGELESTHPV